MPSSPFLFLKHWNTRFAISFCILAFPIGGEVGGGRGGGGGIRNMNILLGVILLILILYSFSK